MFSVYSADKAAAVEKELTECLAWIDGLFALWFAPSLHLGTRVCYSFDSFHSISSARRYTPAVHVSEQRRYCLTFTRHVALLVLQRCRMMGPFPQNWESNCSRRYLAQIPFTDVLRSTNLFLFGFSQFSKLVTESVHCCHTIFYLTFEFLDALVHEVDGVLREQVRCCWVNVCDSMAEVVPTCKKTGLVPTCKKTGSVPTCKKTGSVAHVMYSTVNMNLRSGPQPSSMWWWAYCSYEKWMNFMNT